MRDTEVVVDVILFKMVKNVPFHNTSGSELDQTRCKVIHAYAAE